MTEKLPNCLSPEVLEVKQIPGDVTLGVSREFVLRSPLVADLRAACRDGRALRLRFLVDGVECPDEMLIREWRRRAGTLAIDDGSGGTRVKEGAR